MIDLYIGYGLFILYVFCVVGVSAILWFLMWNAGVIALADPKKTGIEGFRLISAIVCIVLSAAQWVLLSWCDHVVRVMWHSLPPLPLLW